MNSNRHGAHADNWWRADRQRRAQVCAGCAIALACFAFLWIALALTCSLTLGRVVVCPWFHML